MTAFFMSVLMWELLDFAALSGLHSATDIVLDMAVFVQVINQTSNGPRLTILQSLTFRATRLQQGVDLSA
jgi:hypothetical protein